jgi:hypothetical protein
MPENNNKRCLLLRWHDAIFKSGALVDLSSIEKAVILCLGQHADVDTLECYPSLGCISFESGYSKASRSRIANALKTLQLEHNLLETIKHGDRKNTTLRKLCFNERMLKWRDAEKLARVGNGPNPLGYNAAYWGRGQIDKGRVGKGYGVGAASAPVTPREHPQRRTPKRTPIKPGLIFLGDSERDEIKFKANKSEIIRRLARVGLDSASLLYSRCPEHSIRLLLKIYICKLDFVGAKSWAANKKIESLMEDDELDYYIELCEGDNDGEILSKTLKTLGDKEERKEEFVGNGNGDLHKSETLMEKRKRMFEEYKKNGDL